LHVRSVGDRAPTKRHSKRVIWMWLEWESPISLWAPNRIRREDDRALVMGGVEAYTGIIETGMLLLFQSRIPGSAQSAQLAGRSVHLKHAEEGFTRHSHVCRSDRRIEAPGAHRCQDVCSFVEQSLAVLDAAKSTTHRRWLPGLPPFRRRNCAGEDRTRIDHEERTLTWISCRCSTSYRPLRARG
jgi:hypothetical protein